VQAAHLSVSTVQNLDQIDRYCVLSTMYYNVMMDSGLYQPLADAVNACG